MHKAIKVEPSTVERGVYFEDADDCQYVCKADEVWLRVGFLFKYYRTEIEAKGLC